MALSILTWRGEQDGSQEFDAEIGSNRFYAWGVGSGVAEHDGVRLLASRTRTSPLLGPVEAGSRGRVLLRVPSDQFTADDHHLQLLSFRDQDLRGPAVSDIVGVPSRWTRPDRSRLQDGEEDPMATLTLPADRWMRPYAASLPPAHALSTPPPSAAAGPRLSHAQFLDALAGFISQALPFVKQALPVVEQALPVVQQIGQVLAGGPQAGSTGGAAAGAPKADLGQLLSQLLGQVQKALQPAAAAGAPPAQAPAQAPVVPPAGQATGSSLATSASTHYSYASIAPLLAALPALAPLLQSVLTPQTVQSLISAADPNKLLSTTIAGVMDAAKIGQQATDALHAHLRALNPGLGDDVLVPLLLAMSMAPEPESDRYTISRLVQVELPDLAPVELGGYPQVAFRRGEDMTLPVSVVSPRPVPRARLRVCVKDAVTHRRVAERSWSYDRLAPGRLPSPVVLPAALTHRFDAGGEYLVVLSLTWPGRHGPVGATTTQLVRMVGKAVYEGMDTGGAPIRLDDVDRDRDWWHRVWTGTPDGSSSRLRARLEYEYRLGRHGSANRRADTETDLEAVTSRRSEGTVRAALDVSLSSLSRLAQRLTGSAFDDETMEALAAPAFAASFDRSATCSVNVHARRESRVAVWVWPEVKIHDVFVSRPDDVSPATGQVLSFATEPVQVPVPALAHVVSTRSP